MLYDKTFVAYFRSDIDIIVFFVGRDENEWVGGLFNKFFFFYLVGSPKRWAEREMGNTQKNTATLIMLMDY